MGIWDPTRFPDGLDASKADVQKALAMMREQKMQRSSDALLAGIVHANALLQADRASEASTYGVCGGEAPVRYFE